MTSSRLPRSGEAGKAGPGVTDDGAPPTPPTPARSRSSSAAEAKGVRTMKTAVKDVMTTRVIWVRKDAPFREMAAALREHRVSAFPVLDDDRQGDRRRLRGRPADQGGPGSASPGVISGILHRRDAGEGARDHRRAT